MIPLLAPLFKANLIPECCISKSETRNDKSLPCQSDIYVDHAFLENFKATKESPYRINVMMIKALMPTKNEIFSNRPPATAPIKLDPKAASF